jgi:hypothetical protein
MLLQQPSCRLQYATIRLQMLSSCRLHYATTNQIADALVMKSKRGKRLYEMKPLWHNGNEVSALQEWEGSLQESLQGVCDTMALP